MGGQAILHYYNNVLTTTSTANKFFKLLDTSEIRKDETMNITIRKSKCVLKIKLKTESLKKLKF